MHHSKHSMCVGGDDDDGGGGGGVRLKAKRWRRVTEIIGSGIQWVKEEDVEG